MHVPVLVLLIVCLPAVLFVLGCLAQIAVGRRPEAILAVPCTGFVLAACAFVSHITGIPALFTYVPVVAVIAVVGAKRLLSGKMRIPVAEMLIYVCFAAACLVFLGVHRFVSFGGDWIEHGFTVPMSLMAGTTVRTIRPCILGLVYKDFYAAFSPDCSRYYVVQILAACLNANILFMFLSLLGDSRRRCVLTACILFCPFVVYEVAYTWPKFFAVSIAYAAIQLLYSENTTRCRSAAGLAAAVFSVLVHPLAMFVLISVPFFMPGRMKMSLRFAALLAACLLLAGVVPPLLMRAAGIEVLSTSAYYSFSDGWQQALNAANSEKPLVPYITAYFGRVGLIGAVGARLVTFVSMFAPIGGIGRFAFWQNLVFALGPASFLLGIVYAFPLPAVEDRKTRIEQALFALAPVVIGVVFSTGLMVLQVAGGHWLVVVLAAFACRQLAGIEANLARKILAFSGAWNCLFVARCVFSLHAKAPEWAPGLIANLDSLGGKLPGFSHETPVYFADMFDYRIAIALYLLAGLGVTIHALNTGMRVK